MRFSLAIAALFLAAQSASGQSVFQVGNVLTWDTRPAAVEAMADSDGKAWTGGWLVAPQQAHLATLVANPGSAEFYSGSLAGQNWDAIVIQPSNACCNTIGGEAAVMQQVVDAAKAGGNNSLSQIYVMQNWPQRIEYFSWGFTVSNSSTTPKYHMQDTFEHLADRLTTSSGSQVYIVPVGDVLNQIQSEITAGTFPFLTSVDDLYQSYATVVWRKFADHYLSDYGRFAAATTLLATITGESPVGIVPAAEFGALDPAAVAQIQQIAWDRVSTYSRTGVGGSGSSEVPEPTAIALAALAAIYAAFVFSRGAQPSSIR